MSLSKCLIRSQNATVYISGTVSFLYHMYSGCTVGTPSIITIDRQTAAKINDGKGLYGDNMGPSEYLTGTQMIGLDLFDQSKLIQLL